MLKLKYLDSDGIIARLNYASNIFYSVCKVVLKLTLMFWHVISFGGIFWYTKFREYYGKTAVKVE